MKVNLACGHFSQAGYLNIDLYNPKADLIADVKSLPLEDNSVDEALAIHILEHFDYFGGWVALQEWYRILKPGGRIIIESPDLLGICKKFINLSEQERPRLYSHIYGYPWEEGQAHKFAYTKTQLTWTLKTVGFKSVFEFIPMRYPEFTDTCLGIIAVK